MNSKIKYLAKNAITAALYVAITYSLSFLSYNAVQFRLSEIMILLSFYSPSYIPGLIMGCFVANLFGPFFLVDALFGTLATAFSAIMIFLTAKFFKGKKIEPIIALYISSIWPVLSSLIISLGICIATETPEAFQINAYLIAIGEFVTVTLVGVPTIMLLSKYHRIH